MMAQSKSISFRLALVALCLLLASVAEAIDGTKGKDGKPNAEIIADERFELNDKTLSDVMKDFGQEINELMTKEIDQLVVDVKHKQKRGTDSSTGSEENLERFQKANKVLSRDTQERIEMAGKKNEGEITQSGLFGNSDAGTSFLQQVSGKLQSAGTFIGHQMTSLSGLATKLNKQKISRIPQKLKKLMHWPTFLKFKIRFNKVYKSLREELYRQMLYLKTQTLVGLQNLRYLCGRVKHLLKATQFADWTQREYKQMFDNKLAETQGTTPDVEKLSQQQKQYLRELAKSKKNVFGIDAPETGPDAIDRSKLQDDDDEEESAKPLSRRKRSDYNELDDDDDEDSLPAVSVPQASSGNELDDDDDDDEEFLNALDEFKKGAGPDETSSAAEKALENELDEAKVVEEFAAQFDDDADTSDLDNLDNILDDALIGADTDEEEEEMRSFEPIDLRKTGCVLEPENQDTCCACYAFATMSAASYYNCIISDTKQPMRYSPRFLSDCGKYISPETDERPKVNGCRGGRVSHAIKFVSMAGAYEFMDYELARRGQKYREDRCVYPRPEELFGWKPMKNIPPVPVPAYHDVYYANLELDEIDLHLRTVGPVFVNVRVWSGFKDYGGGIVDSFKEEPDSVVHSMLIVGHDRDARGRDYYIILNSHGTAWGEAGFARMYRKSLDYFKVYIGGLIPQNKVKVVA